LSGSSRPTASPLASDRSRKWRCRVGRPLDARPRCKTEERRRGYMGRRRSAVCPGTRPGHKSSTPPATRLRSSTSRCTGSNPVPCRTIPAYTCRRARIRSSRRCRPSQTRLQSPKMRRSLPYPSLRSNPKSRRYRRCRRSPPCRRSRLSRPRPRARKCQLRHSNPPMRTCLPYRRRRRARRSCRRTPQPVRRSPHQTPDALKSSRDPCWH
jgi:hypothetical protein